MISKKLLNIFLMGIIVVLFSLAFAPNEASSQMLGCCLGPSTNCSGGGCGVGNSPCQVNVPGATCPDPCDPMEDESCFVEANVCVSVPGNGNDFCTEGCCVAPTDDGVCVLTNEEDCDEFGEVQIRDDCDQLPTCNGNLTGCCVNLSTGVCIPDQTIVECDEQNINIELDTSDPSCQTIPFCQTEGCCDTDQDSGCIAPLTATECANTAGSVDWTPGAMCLDTPDGAFCGEERGCCDNTQAGDLDCLADITATECLRLEGDFAPGQEMCNDLPTPTCGPIGCCQESFDPNMCSITNEADCTGTWVDGGPEDACLGGDSPNAGLCERNVVTQGCCQTGTQNNPTCFNTIEGECDGTFVESNMCMAAGNCTPLGCCVCGFNECEQTVEELCPFDCTFNEGQPCSPNFDPECIPPPDEPGCCVLDGLGEAAAAARSFDKDKCIETSAQECSSLGGLFKGPGTSCEDCPECLIPRNVPTLGQWGLIVAAGLLGIYSLMMIRRKRAII